MSTRSVLKTTVLVVSLVESLCRFAARQGWTKIVGRRDLTHRERATWLHGCCHRIQRRLRIGLSTNAALPVHGLIVSNHLSHLDILLYGALGPVIFVAKDEVRQWPLLGKLAECGGTVFVDRESPAQAIAAASQIDACLRGDTPVLIFAEGTSTDGSTVLPFRSPLFEPALRAAAPITAAAIAYTADGVEESTLAYYGEKTFFPHLYATLGCRNLQIVILFDEPALHVNRKQAASVTHGQVCQLRDRERSRLRNASPENAQSQLHSAGH